jgi:exosortase
MALMTTWRSHTIQKKGTAGLLGLLILALPLQASLNFYLGYPLRLTSGYLGLLLLKSHGLPVTLDGTMFKWGHLLIQIDAPCSGTNLLWMSLYVTFSLSALYGLGRKSTLFFSGVAVATAVVTNACRMTALFYLESRTLLDFGWLHPLVGMAAFLVSTLFMVWAMKMFERSRPCAA